MPKSKHRTMTMYQWVQEARSVLADSHVSCLRSWLINGGCPDLTEKQATIAKHWFLQFAKPSWGDASKIRISDLVERMGGRLRISLEPISKPVRARKGRK